jgi:hypothetical protein
VSESTAKALIIGGGLGTIAIIFLRRNQLSDPFRNAWAAGALWLFLSLLADIAPQVAGPAALLVLIFAYAKVGKTGSSNIFSGGFKLPGTNPVTQLQGGPA